MYQHNNIHIEGIVKRDESAKVLNSKVSVMDFCLMVNDPMSDGLDVFIDCFAASEGCAKLDNFVSEGERIAVDGFMTFRTYTDHLGRKKSSMVVYVEDAYEIEEG